MTRRRWIADTATETTAALLGGQAEHLARVLRAQPGTEADLVANGRVYRASIQTVSVDQVIFSLLEEIPADAALPVTLLLGIFKFDRMEWAIEKATELGVEAIVPVVARRTEKHLAQAAGKRAERWRRLAQEAAKQSRRADVPRIGEPISLAQGLQLEAGARGIVLAEDERRTKLRERIEEDLRGDPAEMPSYVFAIGPEGGWTQEEIALFGRHGWRAASLGPRILRAETAAIAALAIAGSLLM